MLQQIEIPIAAVAVTMAVAVAPAYWDIGSKIKISSKMVDLIDYLPF